MTRYIAAYDTELAPRGDAKAPPCVEACKAIVDVHRRHEMPATFFIVGRTLEATPDEFRRLLDDPLFEIASHTYSHRMLRDNPFCGKAVGPEAIREEIFRGKEIVEKVFPGRECIGVRPGCSFVDGLRGAPDVLRWVSEAGYEYVSSVAWGPDYTLPAPLTQSFTYADDGFPNLREYPCHGWQENLLKGNNRIFSDQWAEPRRLLAFPPLFPEAVPDGFVETPEEEFRLNSQFFIDRAHNEGLDYVTLIWHPWSLMLSDPDMKMLDMTFRHVRERGLTPTTFQEMHRQMSG